MSKGYQPIALFLTQNPNDVAVRSVNATAERCGICASNFVHFAQALGYSGFRDLQELRPPALTVAIQWRNLALSGQWRNRSDWLGPCLSSVEQEAIPSQPLPPRQH